VRSKFLPHWGPLFILVAQSAFGAAWAADAEEELGEIIVTAGLREIPLRETPASVTVLDSRTVREAGVQHLEELLPLVPNLNWSGGSSRPRYFQLRGIGELDQYQGAPNPSVGFVIDDIDFSGVGMPATLFDIRDIEVLRGPQGTRYGANALAGLIELSTQDAAPQWQLRSEATLGSDDLRGIGAVIGGPIDGHEDLSFRFVAQNERSDGFRHDLFLHRFDTNGRDESTYRAKLRWQPDANLDIRVTAMLVDIDDGYDAFAIDNSFNTLSDQPGRDSQRSAAGSVHIEWQAARFAKIVAISSYADSKIVSSYDADWGNNVSWAPNTPYQYFSETDRRRRSIAQDLRWVSTPGAELGDRFAWLAGIYGLGLTEDNVQHDQGQYLQDPPLDNRLSSRYRAASTAAYTQLDGPLAGALRLSFGLRLEQRQAHYTDTDGIAFAPRDRMLGGQVALQYPWSANTDSYLSLSRGFKAGGFNIVIDIDPARREFSPEYVWNLEAGLRNRWLNGKLSTDVTMFYMQRRDQQVSSSYQSGPDPTSFVFYTDNAASGTNYGLEASSRWQIRPSWELATTLGLLRTRYDRYIYTAVDAITGLPYIRNLSGRDQAHAPRYDFSMSLNYRDPRGWFARVDWSGKDSFYFDASNDERSRAYQLLNLRGGFETLHWSTSVWLHNAFDRRYAVRGFYFADEPDFTVNKLYVRWGDPRQVGVTVSYRYQ
jgi:iron complex outermembrane recepter protein